MSDFHLFIILFASTLSKFDCFDICQSKSITCQCGEPKLSYPIHLEVKQCPRIYRWKPYCGDCKNEPSDHERCAIYRTCLECEAKLNKCLRCPPGRYGNWCTGVCPLCPNGAICHRETGVCQCPEGFTGTTCEVRINKPVQNTGCPTVPSHINGGAAIKWTNQYRTGSSITYKCNDGYKMQGTPTLYCLLGGVWSKQPPKCEADIPDQSVKPKSPDLPTEPKLPEIPEQQIEPKLPDEIDESFQEVCGWKNLTCQCGNRKSYLINHLVKQCKKTGKTKTNCGPCKSELSDEEQCALYRNCVACENNLNQCSACEPAKFGKWCNETEVRSCPPINQVYNGNFIIVDSQRDNRNKSFYRSNRLAIGPRLRSSHSTKLKGKTAFEIPSGHHHVETRVNFNCNSHIYKLEGSISSVCLPSGTWSSRPPLCTHICGLSSDSQWPWQVAIGEAKGDEWDYICSGTVVSESLVLTAAHCVKNLSVDSIRLHFGKQRSKDNFNDTKVKVDKFHIHENYNSETLESDIALIQVTPKITFTNDVQQICLPQDGDKSRLNFGNLGTTILWETEKDEIFQLLVVSNENCEINHRNIKGESINITNNMLCTGFVNGSMQANSDSCEADDGGALIFQKDPNSHQWVQEGVVSRAGCGDGLFTRYTRIRRYNNWIKQHK